MLDGKPNPAKIKTLLLICYKIEKDKGSEDGSGYNFVTHLADSVDSLTLITRNNNVEKLKLDENYQGITLVGVDVPWPLSKLKKKNRGIILYYYLWQLFVASKVKLLQRTIKFDIIHQFNFHTDWAPHFLKNTKGKLVWGPIGHHLKVPKQYCNNSIFALTSETLKHSIKYLFWNWNPFLIKSIKQTDEIVFANNFPPDVFKKHAKKISYHTYAGSTFSPSANLDKQGAGFNILFCGRFVTLKGPLLALEGFNRFLGLLSPEERKSASFKLIGEGPLLKKMMGLKTPASNNIEIISWMHQSQLQKSYAEADVFLFPSFEAQGLVVSEALSQGTPVVCLANTGPSFIAKEGCVTISRNNRQESINEIANSLSELYFTKKTESLNDFRKKAYQRYQKNLRWSDVTDYFLKIYSAK